MQFCDLKCVYASAAREEMDGSRSCMTFTALWCDHFQRHVMKSQPCEEKIVRSTQGAGRSEDRNTEADQ